jgi:hypothetical protein
LIWALASIDPDHQPLFSRLPRARFQFESWPPIDPGASSAIQLRIAAALVRRSLSWTDLLSIPGATPQDAIRVLNAGLHCSLLRTTIETRGEERGEAARAMAVSVQNPQRDPAKRRMWLVEMLRSAIRVELP